MKKAVRFYFFAFFMVLVHLSVGQVVTISPEDATISDEVTLRFDVTQAVDERAEGLLGLTDGVFLWAGAGDDDNAFIYGPDTQINFGQAVEGGEMTLVDTDIWEITITPQTYFNIPNGVEITRLGVLLKNTDGSAQTEDLFVPISAGDFIEFTQPADYSAINFVDIDEIVTISAASSSVGDLEMFIDEGSGFTSVATANSSSTISFGYQVAGQGQISVRVEATNLESEGDDIERTGTLDFFIQQETVVESLPMGMELGINYNDSDDTRATLVFLAPLKERVHVVGDFTNWELDNAYQMKRDSDEETYWLEIDGLTSGADYVFQYWVDGAIRVGDPYADQVADPWNDEFITESVFPDLPEYDLREYGIATVLRTGQTPYEWSATEDTWERPNQEDLIVYELLVRDFIDSHDYNDLIDTLTYIKRLGVNAIELMPIMEFEGNSSWGYNPSYFFAPDKYYGTKNDLKAFIEAAHQNGIAVILDMVLNHAFGQNAMVQMYWDSEENKPATNSPWFNPDAKHPFNVGFDFNHESDYTQRFVDDVNRYWIEEYHFDGYRFDLSKGFTQTDNPDDVGAWNQFDQSRIDLLTRMADEIWAIDEEAYVILEHFADPNEETVLKNEGMMVWGNSNEDFRATLAGESLNRSFEAVADVGRVSYMESHDEERVAWEMLTMGTNNAGDYDIRDEAVYFERTKLGAAFFFTLPGQKMLWQFQELAYDVELNDDRLGEKPEPWGGVGEVGQYYDNTERQKVFSAYAALIDFRKQKLEAIKNGAITSILTGQLRRITIQHESGSIVVIGNFGLSPQLMSVSFPESGTWYDYFSDDTFEVDQLNQEIPLVPGAFHILTTDELAPVEEGLVPFTLPETVTSIDDLSGESVIVYPNPSSQNIKVLYNKEVSSVEMINVIGIRENIQWHQESDGININVSTLSVGNYRLLIHTATNTLSFNTSVIR
ncbi:MAG: alpha-amylase family glycosyl hydrolase [Bacteroidota bacterium]